MIKKIRYFDKRASVSTLSHQEIRIITQKIKELSNQYTWNGRYKTFEEQDKLSKF